MSRATPGGKAWGSLRRELMRDQREPACYSGWPPMKCLYQTGIGLYFLPCGHRSNYWCSFTLQLSGFGVERGRLGEVVSLVGDCRPPPPGNPRRPACMSGRFQLQEGRKLGRGGLSLGGMGFTPKNSVNGGIRTSNSILSTLYKYQYHSNLKELNKTQYFKKNRSSFSCTGKHPVLEFDGLHSHLCGLLEVKPPPIAITNVLETG
jgi:hypothetical protein